MAKKVIVLFSIKLLSCQVTEMTMSKLNFFSDSYIRLQVGYAKHSQCRHSWWAVTMIWRCATDLYLDLCHVIYL